MAQQEKKKQEKKTQGTKKNVTKKTNSKAKNKKEVVSSKKSNTNVKKTKVENKKIIKDLNINDKKSKSINSKSISSNSFSVKEVIVIVVITCIVASICTGSIMYFKFRSTNSISYHKLNDDKKLNEFVDIYSEILDNFYEDVDKDKILDAAINGMVSNLGDDYTSYLTQDEADRLNETLQGEYVGIGIQILQNAIVCVFKDSPAEKAGLLVDDIILKVNDKEVTAEDAEEITDVIKTGESDTINLTVKRGEEELSFDITRAKLDLPAISYNLNEEKGKKIGYIYISSFSNTLTRQFTKALEELESKGMESLIIDVRGNTGGYLTAATGVSSLFIEKGKVLYSLDSKNDKTSYYDETSEHRTYDVVVLINGGTASSSEILAAALKDSYGATIIGTKSYGKGKVQTKKDLSNGTIVKYTNSRWLRPNGECIDGEGIIPDYEVEFKVPEDGQNYDDPQYLKAVEILTK